MLQRACSDPLIHGWSFAWGLFMLLLTTKLEGAVPSARDMLKL